jgi:hypothetical protein
MTGYWLDLHQPVFLAEEVTGTYATQRRQVIRRMRRVSTVHRRLSDER